MTRENKIRCAWESHHRSADKQLGSEQFWSKWFSRPFCNNPCVSTRDCRRPVNCKTCASSTNHSLSICRYEKNNYSIKQIPSQWLEHIFLTEIISWLGRLHSRHEETNRSQQISDGFVQRRISANWKGLIRLQTYPWNKLEILWFSHAYQSSRIKPENDDPFIEDIPINITRPSQFRRWTRSINIQDCQTINYSFSFQSHSQLEHTRYHQRQPDEPRRFNITILRSNSTSYYHYYFEMAAKFPNLQNSSS